MSFELNGIFHGEMVPDAIVAGCVEIYENVWPNPRETIDLIESECLNTDSEIFWQKAQTIGGGKNQNIRTNYNLNITESAREYGNLVAQNINNQFYFLLCSTTIPYSIKHHIPELYHENYQFLKYESGQEYKAHADGNTDIGRSISAILYLNDDYEGGEIEFVNFGITIKPEPGMLLLFPSNYPYAHIAHPVTKGTKYAIVTWIKDRQI